MKPITAIIVVIASLSYCLLFRISVAGEDEKGRIVFSGQINGNPEIFSLDIDGKNLKNLTNHPTSDDFPTPSPNGRMIAFGSWRNGGPAIFIMDVDGKNPRLLIDGVFGRPTWSPDGKWIAFEKTNRLFAININSGELKEIFNPQNILREPSWSPDGKKIAFRALNGGWDIYTINADGTNLRQLTKDPEKDAFPAWSPDSRHVVFYSTRNEGGLFIMDSNGTNLKPILKDPFACCPDWSQAGIVFSSKGGIFVMKSDGNNEKQIFKEGGAPRWLEQKFFSIESEGKSKTIWGKMKNR